MQALIALGLCLALACGIQTFRIGALKEEAAEQAAALANATAAAEKEARAREQQMADNARRAADEYAKNAARIRASADGARTGRAETTRWLAAHDHRDRSACTEQQSQCERPKRQGALLGSRRREDGVRRVVG